MSWIEGFFEEFVSCGLLILVHDRLVEESRESILVVRRDFLESWILRKVDFVLEIGI